MTLRAVYHIVSPILNSKLFSYFSDWSKDLKLVKPITMRWRACQRPKWTFLWVSNLFATSEPPKYSNSNSPNLCFCLLKGDKKTFLLVENTFWTNENVFLSPVNKQRKIWRIGIRIFWRVRCREQVIVLLSDLIFMLADKIKTNIIQH